MAEFTSEIPYSLPNPEHDQVLAEVKEHVNALLLPLFQDLDELEEKVRQMKLASSISETKLATSEFAAANLNPNLRGVTQDFQEVSLTQADTKRRELIARITSLRTELAVLQNNMEGVRMSIRAIEGE